MLRNVSLQLLQFGGMLTVEFMQLRSVHPHTGFLVGQSHVLEHPVQSGRQFSPLM